MKSMPTVGNAATWFNAKTVTHHLDVVDRQVASIAGNIVTSFFETDRDNPWIQVVEERREEHDRN